MEKGLLAIIITSMMLGTTSMISANVNAQVEEVNEDELNTDAFTIIEYCDDGLNNGFGTDATYRFADCDKSLIYFNIHCSELPTTVPTDHYCADEDITDKLDAYLDERNLLGETQPDSYTGLDTGSANLYGQNG